MTAKELNAQAEGLQGYVLLAMRLLVAPLFVYSGVGKILGLTFTDSSSLFLCLEKASCPGSISRSCVGSCR